MRARLADGAKLPPDYETWRVATEQMEREVQRSGVEVVRVADRAEIFAGGASGPGFREMRAARARYAAAALAADWAI